MAGCLRCPAVPAVSGAHDLLVCRSPSLVVRLSGICSPRVPSVCSLQGRFLAVDAEMRLRAAWVLRFSATSAFAVWCGVGGRGFRLLSRVIGWMIDGRVSRKSGRRWPTPGRHFMLPAVSARLARICILQEERAPPTPDDPKSKQVPYHFPSNR